MICNSCGLRLEGGDDAAIFLCFNCGVAHELLEGGLASFSPATAASTTSLAVAGVTQYLAVWRLTVSIKGAADSAWERIRKTTAPNPAYLYVPAFSLMRGVVQRLGLSLTETQPELELEPGLHGLSDKRPMLAEVGDGAVFGAAAEGVAVEGTPDAGGGSFGRYSPVVMSREDARTLGRFVYLAVESHEARDLVSVEYELETTGEELLFIPAVWDPRCIHEYSWRLLLREFDGLVA